MPDLDDLVLADQPDVLAERRIPASRTSARLLEVDPPIRSTVIAVASTRGAPLVALRAAWRAGDLNGAAVALVAVLDACRDPLDAAHAALDVLTPPNRAGWR